jgi:hypothetical protein
VGTQALFADLSYFFRLMVVKRATEGVLKRDYTLTAPQIELQIMEAFGHT